MVSIIGVLTVSDRAYRGEYEDRGGPEVVRYLTENLEEEFEVQAAVVPDEREEIVLALIQMVDRWKCCWVLTTGGTGPAVRDVTPEATEEVCDRMLPGFGERMRAVSVASGVPTAILSRQTAGVRGACLIVNLPGSPRAIRECMDPILPAVPHCIRLIGGSEIILKERQTQGDTKAGSSHVHATCEGCGVTH